MKEVEFTSILLIIIIAGLFERTQGNIEKYYKSLDEEFSEKSATVERFNSIMEMIESSLGEIMPMGAYSNSSMFLQLFHLVDRLEKAGVPLSRSRARLIQSLGDRLKRRVDLPENVKLALASRFNRLSNQKAVAEFLFKNVAS